MKGLHPHPAFSFSLSCSVQVPIAQDEMALSLGYAVSLGNSLQEDSIMTGLSEYAPPSICDTTQQLENSYSPQMASQDLDETTHSDISERPSVDDVESETGSTGALETRSLKDHKGEGGSQLSSGQGPPGPLP